MPLAEPRERANTASRTVAGISSPLAASTSVTKNGLPPVIRYSSAASSAGRRGKRRHRTARQRGQWDSTDSALRRQIAEHDPQRMGRIELVVAVGDDDEDGDRLQPAREQAHDVQGRLIGPMDVLEDEGSRHARTQLSRSAAMTS